MKHPRIRLILTERRAAALLNTLEWLHTTGRENPDVGSVRRALRMELTAVRMAKKPELTEKEKAWLLEKPEK